MIDIREGVGAKTTFKYSKLFLSGCGVWPYQRTVSKRFFLGLWLTQQIIIGTSEIIKLIEIMNNLDLVLEAVPPLLYNRLVDLKLLNEIINQNKMKSLLNKIQKDWNSLSEKTEIEILSEYSKIEQFLNFMYICMVYSVVVACMLLPLTPMVLDLINPLNQSRPLQSLFMVEFFIDEEKYFYTILTQNYISALMSPIPLIGSDIFYMNCTYHACGMITILESRVSNVLTDKHLKKISDAEKYKQLCNCIDMHQRIFEFCDDINKTFSTSFFAVLFLCTILMSFTGVVAVIKSDDLSQFNDTIRFIIFTMIQIFHLFCFNFMGQNLINSMEKLGDNIYNTDWYSAPTKTQKTIIIMYLRNFKSTSMQAILFTLCLPTFTSVMKTSMSYFTDFNLRDKI